MRPDILKDIPDVPYMPLRLEQEEKEFLDSLEGKVEHILIGRREKERFSVLGYNNGRMNFVSYEPYLEEREVDEYVMMTRDRMTGEITEQRGRGVYYNDVELLLFLGTGGLYGLVRDFSGNQRERERIQELFYERAREYVTQNRKELQRDVEQIPIYEGPVEDVERRLGKTLNFIDTGVPDKFLNCGDTFLLRVAAARLGADMIIQYTAGSAVGTPMRVREE